MAEFERLAIPVPLELERVNCYVIGSDTSTIIDPGPATTQAYEEIVTWFEGRDRGISTVDRIVLTHPHWDHFGLANRLKDVVGADVLAHRDATTYLADPAGVVEREQEFFAEFFPTMGVPAEFVEAAVGLMDPFTEYQEPVTVDRTVTDGDVVDVESGYRIIHTPGHAPGAICLDSVDRDRTFTGDQVLPDLYPNPHLTLVPGEPDQRTRSLPQYVGSLHTLRGLTTGEGYGGHGEPIPNLPARIDEVLAQIRTRKKRIAELIASSGPMSPFHIMKELFPDLPPSEMYSGMSEVIGYVDLLEEDGLVEPATSDDVVRYRIR